MDGAYTAEFKYGERNGFGIYTWSNVVKYDGEWKDDEMHNVEVNLMIDEKYGAIHSVYRTRRKVNQTMQWK